MLEWIFTAMTGALLPREDALGKETALAVAAKEFFATDGEEPASSRATDRASES